MDRGTVAILPAPHAGENMHEDAIRPITPLETRASVTTGERFVFGHFQLVPRSRLLLRNGRPVCLGSRAFDLLHTLLTSPGVLVSKERLIRAVWPSTFVDESNLRFQMACLRKALGSERDVIKTVPGRGYVFTADCRRIEASADRSETAEAASRGHSEEIDRPGRPLPFPAKPPESGGEAKPHPDPTDAWCLASLSLVRRSGLPLPAAGLELAVLASSQVDVSRPEFFELLLPVLVLDDAWGDGLGERRPASTAMAIDLHALLHLLRPALQPGGRVEG